jgi:hypothetical protein
MAPAVAAAASAGGIERAQHPHNRRQPVSRADALRDLLVALLREHEHGGALPTSARFLFYELVQRGQLSKTRTGARRPDQNLHDALTDVREDGRVPWDWIVDESRSLDDYAGHPSIKQGMLEKLPFTTLDPWRGATPTVLTESRSLASVLRSVARDYGCRIAATNGQCGGFLRTNVGPTLQPDDRVLYLGDLDLAGDQIEANTRRVLEREVGGGLRWERLALTERQAAEYNLPSIVKRDRRYKDGHPHEAVEPEALGQTVLVDILRRHLDTLLPEPLSGIQERAERQRRRVAAMLQD